MENAQKLSEGTCVNIREQARKDLAAWFGDQVRRHEQKLIDAGVDPLLAPLLVGEMIMETTRGLSGF